MADDDISTQETQVGSGSGSGSGSGADSGAGSGADRLSEVQTDVDTYGPDTPTSTSIPVDAPGALAPGTVLFGAYEIVDILGSGGMGDVYRAKHLSLGGLRAIKVMHPDLHSNREAQERFHQEARALLEVHHPAVVRCHDLLADDAGRVYLVMELIEGIPLSDRMAQSALTPEEVRALGIRVASGLAAAHARGVIHRDLSPDNIVLPDGRPEQAKLIDFGIAKVLASGQETIAEGFKGKLSFASPEQLGFFSGIVDARSDYYALGLVLCAASLGEPLDMGRTFAEAVEARRALLDVPERVPEVLHSQIEPLLAFDPDDRPESVERLFYWSPTAPAATDEAEERFNWAIAAAAGAAVILAFAVGLSFFGGDPSVDELSTTAAVERTPSGAANPSTEPAPTAEQTPDVGTRPPGLFFETLRQQLRSAGRATGSQLAVTPDPVRDGDVYQVNIAPECDCYALLFAIDGAGERIDLLYPNALDRGRRIPAGETLGVPSSQLYVLEAVATEGTDRLKVLIFPEDPHFPPPGIDFWSASAGEQERLGQLSALLDQAASAAAMAADAPLHILP